MESLKYLFLLFVVVCVATGGNACAQQHNEEGSGTIVYGKDWAFSVSVPAGWNFDCCKLAKRYGSNLLVFPKAWDGEGADPDRIMALVVWDKNLTDVDADWDADAKAYMAKFPTVKVERFVVEAKRMKCRSGVYTGVDQVRDYVVFCDPGNDWNFRFGWSTSLHGAHPDKVEFEAAFRQLVSGTVPMHLTIEKPTP